MRLGDLDYAQKQLTIAEVECGRNFQTDCNHVRDFLNALPAIDAVPVVRCGACRWYQIRQWDSGNPKYDCRKSRGLIDVKPDDYCSLAELDGGGNDGL